ncbi:hypothetical protein LPA07_02840 [Lactiplantibacillus paraplantarum]|nr:hypothetical protein LPA07_02840 [Lactiplantibacillus paraplantarum]
MIYGSIKRQPSIIIPTMNLMIKMRSERWPTILGELKLKCGGNKVNGLLNRVKNDQVAFFSSG